jgi:hypothetical protein
MIVVETCRGVCLCGSSGSSCGAASKQRGVAQHPGSGVS